jgi:diphthine synthase
MPLHIIGLGLGDELDVTVKGQKAIEAADIIFLEAYTSILGVDVDKLKETYGKEIILGDRELVESEAERILEPAREKNVVFAVVGDPLAATTHTDLWIRAKEMGIKVQVIHNASIMNAVASCGLQLYTFGQTVSIVFFTEEWRPDSFYDKIAFNRKGGLHTLCLLDIKVKEPDFEAMCMGKKKYLPPRYMTVNTCIEQLLEIEDRRGEGAYNAETPCIGLARVGQDSQCIVSGKMGELADVDFGEPLHSFVIGGTMHELEEVMYNYWQVTDDTPRLAPVAEEGGGGSGSDSDSDA